MALMVSWQPMQSKNTICISRYVPSLFQFKSPTLLFFCWKSAFRFGQLRRATSPKVVPKFIEIYFCRWQVGQKLNAACQFSRREWRSFLVRTIANHRPSNQTPRTMFFHSEISSFASLIGCDFQLNDYFYHSHFGNKCQYLYKNSLLIMSYY